MIRQGHLMVLVGAFLMGCAVLVVAGCAGVRSQARKEEQGHTEAKASEEARCEGTRTFKKFKGVYTTNDIPDCPNGGLLTGTDGRDKLAGLKGDDEIHGLGGSDFINGGSDNDVIYGGAGVDFLHGEDGDDEIHGGDDEGDSRLYGDAGDGMGGDEGDDVLYGSDGNEYIQGGEGRGCPPWREGQRRVRWWRLAKPGSNERRTLLWSRQGPVCC